MPFGRQADTSDSASEIVKKEFTEARGPRRTGACCVSPMPYESIKVQIQITSKICLIGIDEMEAGQDQRYYLIVKSIINWTLSTSLNTYNRHSDWHKLEVYATKRSIYF